MKKRSFTSNKKHIVSIVVLSIACFLSIAVLLVLFIKDISPKRLLSYIGLIPDQKAENYTLLSWENSLSQLQYDADVVFIGDSLTNGENFQEYYKDKKILNLGLSGDSLQGISRRSSIIKHFTPEKIFVQGGINNLAGENIDNLADMYESMIESIVDENPSAKIFIQSVLPISTIKQEKRRTNENIMIFNEHLRSIADKYNITYIDLYSLYEYSGEINPEYTKDGIHLKDDYKYIWLEAIEPYMNN